MVIETLANRSCKCHAVRDTSTRAFRYAPTMERIIEKQLKFSLATDHNYGTIKSTKELING